MAQGAKAQSGEPKAVPPRWYTVDETRHILKCMNYSDEIAVELSTWIVRHLQLAFNKGFEKGARWRASSAAPAQTTLTERVLTYRNQPDNVGAWRLGEACRRAADLPAGDYIDRGLVLLKELQAKGYGVITLATDQQEGNEQR